MKILENILIKEIINILNEKKDELKDHYHRNGKQAYDAGRIDGIKQAIEVIEHLS